MNQQQHPPSRRPLGSTRKGFGADWGSVGVGEKHKAVYSLVPIARPTSFLGLKEIFISYKYTSIRKISK